MSKQMELVVIACCKTKRSGGTVEYSTSPLFDLLSEASFRQLMEARKKLSEILSLPLGPDLGNSHSDERVLYLPAYLRYNGRIYKENDFHSVYPKINSKKVIILSALYGVLDASELIRNYELQMDEKLPIMVKVKTWWKNQGLGQIVSEIVCQDKFVQTHDLLAKSYRDALKPWPPECKDGNFIQYNYPGQGSGSIWRRVEELQRILSN